MSGSPAQDQVRPRSKQALAEVRGWGYVGGLTPDEALRLVDLIPSLGTDTLRWGSAEGREPHIEPDGRVRVAMVYGPVHGAWPSDLKKRLQAAADRVQPGAAVEVVSTARDVKAKRDAEAGDEPVEDEDYAAVLTEAHAVSAQQEATYRAMGSPEVARFPEPLLVRVGDEVHGIYPDGRVQGPKDGRPR